MKSTELLLQPERLDETHYAVLVPCTFERIRIAKSFISKGCKEPSGKTCLISRQTVDHFDSGKERLARCESVWSFGDDILVLCGTRRSNKRGGNVKVADLIFCTYSIENIAKSILKV